MMPFSAFAWLRSFKSGDVKAALYDGGFWLLALAMRLFYVNTVVIDVPIRGDAINYFSYASNLVELDADLVDLLVERHLPAEDQQVTVGLFDLLLGHRDRERWHEGILRYLVTSSDLDVYGIVVTSIVASRDEHLIMTVKDTGIGVAKDDLPKIGQQFFRTNQARQSGSPGTGLGLAIVRSMVEAMHGRFDFQSELGVGTTVTVALPLAHPEVLGEVEPFCRLEDRRD